LPQPNNPRGPKGADRHALLRSLRFLAGLAALLLILSIRPAAADDPTTRAGEPSADRPLVFDTNLGLIQRATEEAIERALAGMKLPPGSEIQLFPVLKIDGDWFVEDRIAAYLSNKGYKVYLIEKRKAKAKGPTVAGDTDGDGEMSIEEAIKASNAGNPSTPTASDTSGAATDTTDLPPMLPPPPNPETQNDQPVPAAPAPGPTGKNPNATPGVPAANLPPVLNEFPEDIEGLVLSFRVVEFGVTYHDQWRQGFLGQRVVERLAAVDLNCRLVSGDEKNILWVGNGRSERLDIVPKSKLDLLEGRAYPFSRPSLPPQSLSRIVEPVLVLGIVAGLVFLFYSNQN